MLRPNDSLSATLEYSLAPPDVQTFQLTMTELDNTNSTWSFTVTPNDTYIAYNITPAPKQAELVMEGNRTVLYVFGRPAMEISDSIVENHVEPMERLMYVNNTIYYLNGGILGNSLVEGIRRFFFCDEFKTYEFRVNKSLPIVGPGPMFYDLSGDNGRGVAIFFTMAERSRAFTAAIVELLEETVHTDEEGSGGSHDIFERHADDTYLHGSGSDSVPDPAESEENWRDDLEDGTASMEEATATPHGGNWLPPLLVTEDKRRQTTTEERPVTPQAGTLQSPTEGSVQQQKRRFEVATGYMEEEVVDIGSGL